MRLRRQPQQKLPFTRGYRIRKGKKSQGIGGALFTLGKNLLGGKKFGSGMFKGVLRAGVTPGSGIGAGLGFAGALAGKSKNPLLQKIGRGLGMAGGVAGMFSGGGGNAGQFLSNIGKGGGQGFQNLMQNFGGGGGGGGGFQNILQTLGKGQGGGGFKNILSSLIGGQSGAGGMRVLKSYQDGGAVEEDIITEPIVNGDGRVGGHMGAAFGAEPIVNGDGNGDTATDYDWGLLPTSTIQGGASSWLDEAGELIPSGMGDYPNLFEGRVTTGGITKASDRITRETGTGRHEGAAAGEEGFQEAQTLSGVGAFNLRTRDDQPWNSKTHTLDNDLGEQQKKDLLEGDFGRTHLSGEGSLDEQYDVYVKDVNRYFNEQGPEKMLEEVKENIANDSEYAKHFVDVNESEFVRIAREEATDKVIGPAHGSMYGYNRSVPQMSGYTSSEFITDVGNPFGRHVVTGVGNRAVHPQDLMDFYRVAEANGIDTSKTTPELAEFIDLFINKTGRSILPNKTNAYNIPLSKIGKKVNAIKQSLMNPKSKYWDRLREMGFTGRHTDFSAKDYIKYFGDDVYDPNAQYGEPSEGQSKSKEEHLADITEERRPAFMKEYFKSKGVTSGTATETQWRLAEKAYENNPDMFKRKTQHIGSFEFGGGGRMRVLKHGGKSYRGGGALSALMR